MKNRPAFDPWEEQGSATHHIFDMLGRDREKCLWQGDNKFGRESHSNSRWHEIWEDIYIAVQEVLDESNGI